MIAKVCAVVIFIVMFALIITEKFERHRVTLACGAAMLLVVFGACMHSVSMMLETLNFKAFITADFWYQAESGAESSSGVNWSTIVFIVCMMIMVEGMAKAGFFRWLCMTIAKLVRYQVVPILITFMVMAAVLSMFIDSITVIMFLAAVTIELARLLEFDPIPMILSEVFCANLGGSATMCGDPPNIIIGTSLGLSFGDFITNTGAAAGIALIVVLVYYYLIFRKKLAGDKKASAANEASYPLPSSAIIDRRQFTFSTIIFLAAVVLLVTHAQTGLTVATIGIIIAAATLLCSGREAWSIIKGIDYKTALFFVGLFVVVGGLEQTGILTMIANLIEKASGGHVMIMVTIIIWVSGICSAFIDNIPFAATMIPVIKSLAATTGTDLSVLAWSLSLGTDIGGSATPIGASANVVGISIAEKEGYSINWASYCRANVAATVIVLAIATVFIWVRYGLV